MENFLQEITPALSLLLEAVILGLIGLIVPKIRKFFDEKGLSEKLSRYDYLADIAVKAAEQIYEQEQGAEKLAHARMMILEHINRNHEVLSEIELDSLIESAVKRMNDEWTKAEPIEVEVNEY